MIFNLSIVLIVFQCLSLDSRINIIFYIRKFMILYIVYRFFYVIYNESITFKC